MTGAYLSVVCHKKNLYALFTNRTDNVLLIFASFFPHAVHFNTHTWQTPNKQSLFEIHLMKISDYDAASKGKIKMTCAKQFKRMFSIVSKFTRNLYQC